MGNIAKTVDEQISLLQSRGMIIDNIEKAKEVLLDVGYYRLGFYWYPFEKPVTGAVRTHEFKVGTSFDDAVKLYYLDYSLRNILIKYITRIEVNFRTHLIYSVSNKYKSMPTWFVSPNVVQRNYITSFDKEVYNQKFKRNKVIANHHRIHINDRYAPAWKTLEFMTLGSNIALYKALLDIELKKQISKDFGINYTGLFENYLDVVRCVRNTCAHGGLLYDIDLYPLIRKGPAGLKNSEEHKLSGALKVVKYLLSMVSSNRAIDFEDEIKATLSKYVASPALKEVLISVGGFNL